MLMYLVNKSILIGYAKLIEYLTSIHEFDFYKNLIERSIHEVALIE